MNGLIKYELKERVAHITINRPEKRNALNPELVGSLRLAFGKAEADAGVKVVVLKAKGKVFSAGADLEYLRELQDNSAEDDLEDTRALKDLLYSIYAFPKIVIAQVEGHAIAGGCGLAAVCDLVFSVPQARFGYTEVKIGFIPALVTCFLVRKLGEGRVRELLLSGELIGAETASRYGLINFIAEPEDIAIRVSAYAEKLVNTVSGNSVRLSKQLIRYAQDKSLEESLGEAVRLNVQTRASADCKRGIAAFLNREEPEW